MHKSGLHKICLCYRQTVDYCGNALLASSYMTLLGDYIQSYSAWCLQAVSSVAMALLQLAPQPLFQQHCQALFARVASPVALLSSLGGAPTGPSAPAVPLPVQVSLFICMLLDPPLGQHQQSANCFIIIQLIHKGLLSLQGLQFRAAYAG